MEQKAERNIRFNLQAKLTILIVILIFVITSLSTTVMGVAQAYIENILLLNVVTAAVSICLGALGAYAIIRIILRKALLKLTELAHAFNENDYSKRIQLKTGDEFQTLAEVFNKTAMKMEKLIDEIQESSEILENQTNVLKGSLSDSLSSSELIDASTEEFSAASDQMAQEVNRIAEESNTMSASLQQFTVSVKQVNESASSVMRYVKVGDEAISSSFKKAESTKSKVDETIQNVTMLSEKSKAINDVIAIISGISEQTNLLALNASIEAARAGEHGKGFAVVANEVQKLAAQSKESTIQIQQLINNIQTGISEMVADAKVSGNEIDMMVQEVKKTEKTIKDITRATLTIKEEINEVTQTIGELSKSSEQVNDSMMNTSAVIEESNTSVQEIAASTKQQTSALNDINAMSSKLQELTKNLDSLVNKFKTSKK